MRSNSVFVTLRCTAFILVHSQVVVECFTFISMNCYQYNLYSFHLKIIIPHSNCCSLSRYLVLANMLMESEVNPFDGQEAKP